MAGGEGTSHTPGARRGAALAIVVLIAVATVFAGRRGSSFTSALQELPRARAALAVLALASYPLLLALIEIAAGRAPLTPRGLVTSAIGEAVGLLADLLLLALILLPVGLSLSLALISCLFMAMTLAGTIWSYRWIQGTHQPAETADLALPIAAYLGMGIALILVAILRQRLRRARQRYLRFAHGLHERVLAWVAGLRR